MDIYDASDEDFLCSKCHSCGIWNHLYYTTKEASKPTITGFVTDPSDLQDPERKSCPFCRLVFELLPENGFSLETQHLYKEEGQNNYVLLIPRAKVIDGHCFTSFTVVFHWKWRADFNELIRADYRGEIGLDRADRRDYDVEGVAPARLSKRIDVRVLGSWIKTCEEDHPRCKAATQRTRHGIALDILLLDVYDNRLVKATTDFEYVALSYVWGKVKMLNMTGRVKDRAMEPEGFRDWRLWDGLPRVMQDCIHLAEDLRVRYVWVDALCIDQENPAEKLRQIMQMDLIYSQALMTIVAMSGENASRPIPGVDASTRSEIFSPLESTNAGRLRKGGFVVTKLPAWGAVELESPHGKRAWTLQEVKLSIRSVSMTRWGMSFQCLSGVCTDGERNTRQISHRNDIPSILALEVSPAQDWCGWDESRLDEFNCYAQHIDWYTSRNLTFSTDRLDAFQGILSRMRSGCRQDFLWGHPEGRLFGLSLLWIPVDAQTTKIPKKLKGQNFFEVSDMIAQRDKDYPTWSWAGWSTRASYRIVIDMLDAGHGVELDVDVDIELRETIDATAELRQDCDAAMMRSTVGRPWSPALFRRWCNRGIFDIWAPTISVKGFRNRLGKSLSGRIDTIDGTFESCVFTEALYF